MQNLSKPGVTLQCVMILDFFTHSHPAGLDTIFSHIYLFICEVNLFELLDIMAQMWHCINFFS